MTSAENAGIVRHYPTIRSGIVTPEILDGGDRVGRIAVRPRSFLVCRTGKPFSCAARSDFCQLYFGSISRRYLDDRERAASELRDRGRPNGRSVFMVHDK